MLLLLLACAGSDGTGSPEDTASPDDDTSTGETDTAPTGFACPAGMSPVPTESPAWCIDTYELALVDGALVSGPGLEPLVGYSFEEAVAACAATPALDADGEAYAMRHLATAEEWEDAGDGIVGEGGTTYPWGDTYDATVCVTLAEDGSRQVDQTQLTGSMATCVGPFGLYDQVGNVWEWTDSGVTLHVDTGIAAFAAAGVTLAEDEDGTLVLVGGSVGAIGVDCAGLSPNTLAVTPEGWLQIEPWQIQTDFASFFARGYLLSGDHAAPLPVVFVSTDTADPEAPWRVHTAREYDGRTLPDKRGCAWYTGSPEGCSLDEPALGHLPDFDGTIGFRCVAPPYPL